VTVYWMLHIRACELGVHFVTSVFYWFLLYAGTIYSVTVCLVANITLLSAPA